ncbi:MAG TPA: tetratricopeptide repeat protein, partial [Candidatus Kryptobacter bacterium]|nr:tetratricopeptide repeat protein [Candidatus Kryptobacter bacterium]
ADTLRTQTAVTDNNYLDRLRYEAARALYYLGNYDSASFYLEKIVSNPMSDAANEAIQLLNVISNNKAVPDALKQYASAGAMEVCGRVPEAAVELEEIVKTFPQVPLADNARFDLAAAYCRMGKIDRALKTYSSIAGDSTGIFADRAQFRIARIYQTTLHDTGSAIKEYENFLARFPHSIYQDKVRGMLRDLLGNNS